MIMRLLASSDGKIPYLQIIIGAVLGAIAMLAYAKFFRPRILYEEKFTVPLGPSVANPPPQKGKNGGKNAIRTGNGKVIPAPVRFETQPVGGDSIQIPRGQMPPELPSLDEDGDEDDGSSISGTGTDYTQSDSEDDYSDNGVEVGNLRDIGITTGHNMRISDIGSDSGDNRQLVV